ncbi:MAG: hypothetical protein AMXMBFR34_14010 [Myxococcaceae bacterium]
MHRALLTLTALLALPALADAEKDARAVAEAFVAAANIKDPAEPVKKVGPHPFQRGHVTSQGRRERREGQWDCLNRAVENRQ